VNLRFRDAITGHALAPRVAIVNLRTGESLTIPAVSVDGRLHLLLSPGEYAVSASMQGYDTIGMTLSVADVPLPPYELYLDPLVPPKEVTTEFLQSLRQPGQMVVVGFVTDEQSGQPIEGVRVSVIGHDASALTDSRGGFLLQFPVRDTAGVPQRYATLLLEKEGYQTLRLEQLEIWSEGDWIGRPELDPWQRHRDTRDAFAAPPRNHALRPLSLQKNNPPDLSERFDKADQSDFAPAAPAPIVLPKYIRVGRNCTTRTDCQRVEVYTLETYCKGVITNEWYACWGNVSGRDGIAQGRCGRCAQLWGLFCLFPATSTYDICDSTACQVFTGQPDQQRQRCGGRHHPLCLAHGFGHDCACRIFR
jgi:hypothetical protein